MAYTIEDHKHRFSVWAASRAASVITCCINVEIWKKIIEVGHLQKFIDNPSLLPEPQKIDTQHREW